MSPKDKTVIEQRFDVEIGVAVYDFTKEATWGLSPGFYWTVLVDENGAEIKPEAIVSNRLIGPFETTDLAMANAQDFLDDCDNKNYIELGEAA